MNKKILTLILSFLACVACVSCAPNGSDVETPPISSGSDGSTGDVETPPETVTVTFRQNGKDDVVVTLAKGGAVSVVPMPAEKTGYVVRWDRTDFSVITESIVVNAVETAKVYTVTLNANGGSINEKTLTLTYGQAYELPAPMHTENIFEGWTYAGASVAPQGVWEIDGDNVVLMAEWNECLWSGNY